jgi:hypothetical protein
MRIPLDLFTKNLEFEEDIVKKEKMILKKEIVDDM